MGYSFISVLCFTLKFFSELRSKIYFIYNFEILLHLRGREHSHGYRIQKYRNKSFDDCRSNQHKRKKFLVDQFCPKNIFLQLIKIKFIVQSKKKLPTKVEKTHAKSDRRQASMVWGMMLRKQTMEDWRRESIAERSLYPQI